MIRLPSQNMYQALTVNSELILTVCGTFFSKETQNYMKMQQL